MVFRGRRGSRHSRLIYAIENRVIAGDQSSVAYKFSDLNRTMFDAATDGIRRKFAMKHDAIAKFCTAKFFRPNFFCTVRSIGCRCRLRYLRFQGSHEGPTLSTYDFCVRLRPVNEGGTFRGPYLEAQRTGSMRCIRFCRRSFAGCILSSRGQRRRQTNKLPV